MQNSSLNVIINFKSMTSVNVFSRRNVVAGYNQCDQIGRFFKILGNKFAYKNIQNIGDCLGLHWKTSLSGKHCSGYFWATFRNIWPNFLIPTSGHTARTLYLGSHISDYHLSIAFSFLRVVKKEVRLAWQKINFPID